MKHVIQNPIDLLRRVPAFAGLVLLSLLLFACGSSGANDLPFVESFDAPGQWSTGEDAYSSGQVVDGGYHFTVTESDTSRWASAGRQFGDGVYTVEARVTDGPLDNGYGMIFRANPESGDFYLFKISADGYAWIGRYAGGVEDTPIIGNHWFESAAIQQGLNVTNILQVRAEAGNLIFFINGQEVGRVTDETFAAGDVGLLVQALGEGGVEVLFDNLSVVAVQ